MLRQGALEGGARVVLGRLAPFGLAALFAELREPLRDVGLLGGGFWGVVGVDESAGRREEVRFSQYDGQGPLIRPCCLD